MLFDNNYGFDMNLIEASSNSSNILSPYESFLRGNSFKDLYDSYKNYTYMKLKPTNNKEKLLFEIMSLCFIVNDLNLYLDLNSNDKEAFNLFTKYIEEEKALQEKYVKEYGPLTLDEVKNTYNWLGDMPWESTRGDIYV
ncbi:MAG: spore coat protein CotJB [Bacilli bacterium]|nr:spore coat protein CotJB [Bacilli bacterium]